MNTDREITLRWLWAYDLLKDKKRIKNDEWFYRTYHIDKRNFVKIRIESRRKILPWLLAVLVVDFEVNATWLLTGKGLKFDEKSELNNE